MRLIVCLCATALLAVCASQLASADEPVAPTPTPAPAEPSAEATSTPATTAEATPPATAPEAKPAAAPAEKEVTQSSIDRKVADAKKEYMEVEKDGQTLYCKRERKIGTRLPQYLCMTEAELINRVRSNEDMVDRGRLPKPCTSGRCSGG